MGLTQFSEFDLVGRSAQFKRGLTCNGKDVCMGDVSRLNIKKTVTRATVLTPYVLSTRSGIHTQCFSWG